LEEPCWGGGERPVEGDVSAATELWRAWIRGKPPARIRNRKGSDFNRDKFKDTSGLRKPKQVRGLTGSLIRRERKNQKGKGSGANKRSDDNALLQAWVRFGERLGTGIAAFMWI